MRNGYSTVVVLIGLALVCLVGWAASHTGTSASPGTISATVNPGPAPVPNPTPVPACTAAQVRLAYLTGQPVGGHDFGIIAVWDQSPAACSLAGPVTLTGLGQAGRPATKNLKYEVSAPGLLSARGTRPGEGMQISTGEGAAPLIVAASYSDDSSAGHRACARPLEPAAWRLTIPSGGTLTVANADPQATSKAAHGLPADHGLLTCGGLLDAPAPVVVPSPPG